MTDANILTIVVVDDDEGVRESTRVLLETFGYATRGFSSADALLQAMDGLDCDCLVLDVQMPGTGGIELLERLRARAFLAPAILMTANIEGVGERTALAGALTVLRKPFAPDMLLRWIARACGRDPGQP